jgi:DNA polymerase-3 subunit epsilon
MFAKPLVVIDFETSGMSPDQGGRVIEVAALRLHGDQVTERFVTLINSNVYISPFITELTGITQSMVSRAPLATEVIPQLLAFIGEDSLVAHNASFDEKFLLAEAARFNQTSRHDGAICSVKLARRILPGLSSYALGSLSKSLNIQFTGRAHRAEADAEVTVNLMRHLGQKLREDYNVQQIDPALLQAINKLSAAKVSHFLKKSQKHSPLSATKLEQSATEYGSASQYFQHYKGGIYELIAEAIQESDLTPVIVYKAQNGSWWTRPKEVFFEEIELNGVMVPRFKLIKPLIRQ